MPKIGLIGGSGLREISGFKLTAEMSIDTPFGQPSDSYKIGELFGVEIAFLARHGALHSIAPHKVNYRANIWGFKSIGVERIISVSASGVINTALSPGEIVILEQIVDFTQGARAGTFYEEGEVVHIDFTEPYCPELKDALSAGAEASGIERPRRVLYICTNGPRLESRAEIKFFASMGGDIVGMTGMPEAALARELQMCYAGLSVVTNYAAGIKEGRLSALEVIKTMKEAEENIRKILQNTLSLIPAQRGCPCKDALKEAKV